MPVDAKTQIAGDWEWQEGWWQHASVLPSAHCHARPEVGPLNAAADVSLLVIHNISLPPGEFGGGFVQDLFTGQLNCDQHPYFEQLRGLRVSAHFFIERSGGVIQFVAVDQCAWHAGVSSFQGRERCNDFSLGIELEGVDDLAYTAEQYAALQILSLALLRRFPALSLERITGHQQIAPGRKTDPGPAFSWDDYRRALCANWSTISSS